MQQKNEVMEITTGRGSLGAVSTGTLALATAAMAALGLLLAPRVYHNYDVVDCFLTWARASGGRRPWDIYLTDSGIEMEEIAPGGQLNPDYRKLKYDGRVFRIDPRTGAVERVDRGLLFANGIAFGPDEHLYVAETLSGNIYRYECMRGRVTGKRQLFGNVIEHFDPAELKGPDGMKFGADGNLYVAVFGQGDITILGRAGAVVGRLETEGAMPTNLVFGPRGEKKIYVTEVVTGSVQILDAVTGGLPLHD